MSLSSLWNMLIQFIFFPILARIYAPEVYGSFSVLNSVVIIAGGLLSLGYQRAIVLPDDDYNFRALLRLNVRTTFISFLLLFFTNLLLGDYFARETHIEHLGWWIYSIAPLALFMAIDQIIVQWSIREKLFRRVAAVDVPLALGSKLFNVGYGKLISASAEGLILTSALMWVGRSLLFISLLFKDGWKRLFSPISQATVSEQRNIYRNYPKYILTGSALNTASGYIPVIVLPIMTGRTDLAGFFTYALIVLDLPVRLLGSGVASVFLQKSAELWQDNRDLLRANTMRLFNRLVLLSAPMVIVIGSAGAFIYRILFGDRWEMAGSAASILVLAYFFRYIAMPLSSLFITTRNEASLFVFQALLFTVRLLGIVIPLAMGIDFLGALLIYSIATAIVTFAFALWPLYLTGNKVLKPAIITVFVYMAAIGVSSYLSALF